MFMSSFRGFLRDETGSYTVWSLIWFSLYVAMGGLAVDLTDAYRNQTMLQATADASALAAALSLPDEAGAKDQAVAYSTDNMLYGVNGTVLNRDEVLLGTWDFATKSFTDGATPANAVRVITRRDDANANPLAANFLRILSLWGIPLDRFNISVEAIAVQYVPGCLTDGFVAGNWVDINSGNRFYNDICIHGQNQVEDNGQDYGVDISNGNTFDPGVTVSTPYPDEDITNNNPTCSQNSGLCGPNGAKRAGDAWPKDVYVLDDIMAGLLDPASVYMPGGMYQTDPNTGVVTNPAVVTIPNAENYSGPYLPFTAYDMRCGSGNKTVNLPTDTEITNVVIVADCNINASSGVELKGVALASTYVGNGPNGLAQNSINLAAGSILGEADNCAPGGGVELYSAASIQIAAGGDWNGLRAVAAYDFKVTSNTDGAYGISVQAGNMIDMSSNNDFGLCSGGIPGVFAWQYRLVR